MFADELVRIGAERDDVIAITAAMLRPTGLAPFAERFPDRVYDVGIAEQHAAASAAGLAYGGLHPVVALYSTFVGRAFDQVLMDVALHRAGVTFVLDRAGVTGPDGPSHHGMWDLALLHIVPEIRIAAPRDEERVREELREAVATPEAPTVVRYSKGSVPETIDALERLDDGVDVLSRDETEDVLIVGIGPFAGLALDVAERLRAQGIGATVVDPRWVVPVPSSVVELAARHRLVITLEDGIRVGGIGTRVRQVLREAGIDTAVDELGLPRCVPRPRLARRDPRRRGPDAVEDRPGRRVPGPRHSGPRGPSRARGRRAAAGRPCRADALGPLTTLGPSHREEPSARRPLRRCRGSAARGRRSPPPARWRPPDRGTAWRRRR